MIELITFVGFLFCIGFLRMMFREARTMYGSDDSSGDNEGIYIYDAFTRTSMSIPAYDRMVNQYQTTGLKTNYGIWVSKSYFRREQLNKRAEIAWELYPDDADARLEYWLTGQPVVRKVGHLRVVV